MLKSLPMKYVAPFVGVSAANRHIFFPLAGKTASKITTTLGLTTKEEASE